MIVQLFYRVKSATRDKWNRDLTRYLRYSDNSEEKERKTETRRKREEENEARREAE